MCSDRGSASDTSHGFRKFRVEENWYGLIRVSYHRKVFCLFLKRASWFSPSNPGFHTFRYIIQGHLWVLTSCSDVSSLSKTWMYQYFDKPPKAAKIPSTRGQQFSFVLWTWLRSFSDWFEPSVVCCFSSLTTGGAFPSRTWAKGLALPGIPCWWQKIVYGYKWMYTTSLRRMFPGVSC